MQSTYDKSNRKSTSVTSWRVPMCICMCMSLFLWLIWTQICTLIVLSINGLLKPHVKLGVQCPSLSSSNCTDTGKNKDNISSKLETLRTTLKHEYTLPNRIHWSFEHIAWSRCKVSISLFLRCAIFLTWTKILYISS